MHPQSITLSPADVVRFWAKVDKHGPVPESDPSWGPCWLWLGAKSSAGYGNVQIRPKHYGAHRVAYYLAHGAWPAPLTRHRCHRPSCVNPAHLLAGTSVDNYRDMLEAGRRVISARDGVHNGRAKLTAEQVVAIRERYAAGGVYQHQLAAAYDVSQPTIMRIVRQQGWASSAERQSAVHGCLGGPSGARNGRARLTVEQVQEARARRAQGWSALRLARFFGVAKSTMQAVVSGKSWAEVE